MKTFVFCLGVIAFATYGQDSKPLAKSAVALNPLGFLQFGPIVQGEFELGQSPNYLCPYFRYSYFGLLYQAIATEGFENTLNPLSLGLGLQYKYLKPVSKGAWYFGLGLDYSFGATKGGDSNPWEGKHAYVAPLANAGFRWRPANKNIFFGLGILAGPALALRDEWWYLDNPSFKYDDSQNYIFGMGEFVIGWEKPGK